MTNEMILFSGRKTYIFDFEKFTDIMQNILDDRSLVINDEPILSMYSSWHDNYYLEKEILERIGE